MFPAYLAKGFIYLAFRCPPTYQIWNTQKLWVKIEIDGRLQLPQTKDLFIHDGQAWEHDLYLLQCNPPERSQLAHILQLLSQLAHILQLLPNDRLHPHTDQTACLGPVHTGNSRSNDPCPGVRSSAQVWPWRKCNNPWAGISPVPYWCSSIDHAHSFALSCKVRCILMAAGAKKLPISWQPDVPRQKLLGAQILEAKEMLQFVLLLSLDIC